jgi:hypothetical protein
MNWQQITDLFGKGMPLDAGSIIAALFIGLLCSVASLLMYNYFYGRDNVGAGVQRSFLLMGPSITALFLGIQFSLPLSLGLLGALSIIRFRTPVKDPAEIGFLMLLIAGAICTATFNYTLLLALYVISFLALLVVQLLRKPFQGAKGSLIINIDGSDGSTHEKPLTRLVSSRLQRARLQSISSSPAGTSLQYTFTRSPETDWGAFNRELADTVKPGKLEVFIS